MISDERKCWILIFKFGYTFFAGHPVERENWVEIRLETILLAIHCFEHFPMFAFEPPDIRKPSISYPLIRIRAYQEVRNVRFSNVFRRMKRERLEERVNLSLFFGLGY